jgi:hypothetical protein
MVKLTAAHGNLRTKSSSGFAVTMAGELPPVIRMVELGPALREMGISWERDTGDHTNKLPQAVRTSEPAAPATGR